MKTIIVTIGGTPTPGDLLVIEYSHTSRGGVSAIKAKVRPPRKEVVTDPATGTDTVKVTHETVDTLAKEFVDEITRGQAWGSEFQASVRPDKPGSFVAKCAGENHFADIAFKAYVEGAGTETIGIEVL